MKTAPHLRKLIFSRHMWIAMPVLLLTSRNIAAGEFAYTCQVKQVYLLADDGSLKASVFEEKMEGTLFAVSRLTGAMLGDVVPTLLAKATHVVNRGSDEYSLKSVADFEGQVQVLEVREFAEGSIKPFAALSIGGAGIVTGTCT